MFTVNQLAKKYGLSRSTLLYYDKIDLLKPSARSSSNYRLYSAADKERMDKITVYKDAGLPLDVIADILDSDQSQSTDILEQRLQELNKEISGLRHQQQHILALLGKDSLVRTTKTMSKERWVSILRASGLDDDALHKWHIEFEKDMPTMHQDFLESLGCSPEEVDSIRAWSRALRESQSKATK